MRRYLCRDCKFWNETGAMPPGEGSNTVVTVGECRHAPPIGNPRSWPATYESDWCGRIEAIFPPPPRRRRPRRRRRPEPVRVTIPCRPTGCRAA